jgi:asparagine synthetase B (glutamine-hydrolysing)
MSGILAVFHRDGRPVATETVRRMATAMADAGPDGLEVWTRGEIGLAVASFHTVPEQVGEPAPLVNGDLAIAFDGRIDNRAELRRALAARGQRLPPEAGDGAHVLAAYRVWGDELPPRLIGEHAFVLWDGRTRRILGVRDHVGVRALRWWSDGRTLVACSHFAPILAHPAVPARPNEGVVAEWLCNMPTSIDESLWDGVLSVPGGGRLRAGRDHPGRVDRYWRPQDEIGRRRIRSADEAREMLVELVTEAVRCRMRAVGRPLVELSGGWDSSTVAVVAHDLHAAGEITDFELFAALYPGLPCDETPWIEAVEQQLARTATRRPQAPADPVEDERTVRALRHPFARDPLREIVVSAQRRVGLTGQGGDEVVGGMFYDLGSLLDPRRARRASGRGARALLHETARPLIRPLLPVRVRAARLPTFPPWVSPALLQRTSLAERVARREPLVTHGSVRSRATAASLDSFSIHMMDLDFELERGPYLEYRHPMLDVRLVRFALALPARIAGTFDTDPRRLHAAAFGDRLPRLVRARRLGTDFIPFYAIGMRRMRAFHRGCPRLVAEGWLLASKAGPLDDEADTSAGLGRALMSYSLDAWHTTKDEGDRHER